MGRLLQFEFRKLFRQKSFYICSAILVASILITIYTLKFLTDFAGADVADAVETLSGVTETSGLGSMLTALSSSSITTVLAVFIPLFVCDDFSSGTIKNVIAKGYSRTAVFASKYLVSVVAAVIMSIICWAGAYIAGTAIWYAGTDWTTTMTYAMMVQLLIIIAYLSVYFLISSLIKKSGGSISICVVAPMLVSTAVLLADALIKKKKFEISDYWLADLLSKASSIAVANQELVKAAWCAVVYIVVAVAATLFLNSKSEV